MLYCSVLFTTIKYTWYITIINHNSYYCKGPSINHVASKLAIFEPLPPNPLLSFLLSNVFGATPLPPTEVNATSKPCQTQPDPILNPECQKYVSEKIGWIKTLTSFEANSTRWFWPWGLTQPDPTQPNWVTYSKNLVRFKWKINYYTCTYIKWIKNYSVHAYKCKMHIHNYEMSQQRRSTSTFVWLSVFLCSYIAQCLDLLASTY